MMRDETSASSFWDCVYSALRLHHLSFRSARPGICWRGVSFTPVHAGGLSTDTYFFGFGRTWRKGLSKPAPWQPGKRI